MERGAGFKKKLEGFNQERREFGKARVSNRVREVPIDDSLPFASRREGGVAVNGDALCREGGEGSWVSINLDFKSRGEISELKMRFESELVMVRGLMKRVEQYSGEHGKKLKRVHSEVGSSVEGYESRSRGGMSDKVVRGMRTPTVPVMQKISDVTPSEEKLHSSSLSKKAKANGKKSRDDSLIANGMQNPSSKVFKSCSSLLTKLMKCKGGWVFNTPVDAKTLGLVDYFTIIKDPMDLGTVRTRLRTNRYRTPEEFAEDLRLTFHNATTYNMEGHEINTLAKQFLQMFEDRWARLEAECLSEFNSGATLEAVHPNPVRTKRTVTPPLAPPVTKTSQPSPPAAPQLPPPSTTPPLPPPPTAPPLPPPTDISMIVNTPEAVTNTDAGGPDVKSTGPMAAGRSRLPKPRAKDLDKRDMTIEEKEKLSAGLQNLPAEKLEGVLKIIKKRNASLYQDDDEIEVDIDTVDTETLWELDRFVIYYKKALSKMKRSVLLGQIGVGGELNLHDKSEADGGMELTKEDEADEVKMFSSPSNEGGQEGRKASGSDGSSSSSSDSGSSSSGMRINRKMPPQSHLCSFSHAPFIYKF